MILNLMLFKLLMNARKREDTVTRQESVQITNATLANSTIENVEKIERIKLKSKLQV